MLPRPSRPLIAVRAFIRAPPACTASTPLALVSACAPRRAAASTHVARLSTNTAAQPTPVPHALTAAARTFQEQVERRELDFLPQAYEHLRQVVLEAVRRGLAVSDADMPIVPEDVVKRARELFVTSPQREYAVLHQLVFDDLPLLRIRAEMAPPVEFAAEMFKEYIKLNASDTLPHIYDHLMYLADVMPAQWEIFAKPPWRAQSWMSSLAGVRATDLLSRILHDLPRRFGVQPTSEDHQLIIKTFLAHNMPDDAWAWLRRMELHHADGGVWLKPQTAHYNLLIKDFAARGDVLPIRMLLAHMAEYAAPSQVSYHHLLAAVLAAPHQHQYAHVAAAVEEMERAGHGVHLKMLGGVAGRGSVTTWIPQEVFGLLRGAQARNNARAHASRATARKQGEASAPNKELPGAADRDRTEAEGGQKEVDHQPETAAHAETSSQLASNAVPEPQARDIATARIRPSGSEDATGEHAKHNLTGTLASVMTTLVSKITSPSPATTPDDTRAVGANVTPVDDVSLRTKDRAEEERQPFQSRQFSAEPKNNTPPIDVVAPKSPADVEGEIQSTNSPSPAQQEDASASSSPERPQEEIPAPSHVPDDPPTTPPHLPEQSEIQQSELVKCEELGVTTRIRSERTTGRVSPHSATRPSRPKAPPKRPPEAAPAAVEAEPNEKSPQEPAAAKPATNGDHNGRVRHKYIRVIRKTIQSGDLREASKAYAELTAITGPDIEAGSAMIAALCQGHLLQPPPRPHILQALRIYRSLVEVEKRDAEAQGFFDGANRAAPENTRIGAHTYKHLLLAVSAPTPVRASLRDFPESYKEHGGFATELLADMKARGFKPDGKTLVSVILLRFRGAKDHREAFEYYESAVADDTGPSEPSPNDQPDKNTCDTSVLGLREYRAILNAFASLSFSDAPLPPAPLWFSIADDMRARGHPVTAGEYTKFLAFVPDRQTTSQGAQRLNVRDPFPNDEQVRLKAMYACVQHIHRKLALDATITPDAYLLNTLMNAYQRVGSFEDALRVFNTIWLSGRMDAVTPIVIFDACGHAGRTRVAHIIWCMLVAKGWKFNKQTLDTWVECLCRTNVEAACRFVCVYMGREDAGYLSDGDTRPDVQTCLILLKLSWRKGQNNEVKERIGAHLPHIWEKLATRYQ